MDSIYSKIGLWFTFILGLSMLSYGFVAGPISFLSLLDVISGNKPFSELHKQRPIPTAITVVSEATLEDDNVYAVKDNFYSELNAILRYYLVDLTQEEIDLLWHSMPNLYIKRQMYVDFKTENEKSEAMSVSISKSKEPVIYSPMPHFDKAESAFVTSLLMGKEKALIEVFLKANNLLTKSSGSRIQSNSVMFEFSPTQKLLRIYSR
jgi:hypothetical protein